MALTTKTRTITWQEGAGSDPATDPAFDDNGNRRIVVPTAGQPWIGYVPDDDTEAAKTVIDVQRSLGIPA